MEPVDPHDPAPSPDPDADRRTGDLEDSAVRYRRIKQLAGADPADRWWVGRDPDLDRAVVLECVDVAGTDDLLARARFLARLEDAGVPAIHDLVRHDRGAVLAMRHIDGTSLAQAMHEASTGRSPAALADVPTILRAFGRLSDAIAAAHASGVVHGRLTAEAITLTRHRAFIGHWDAAMAAFERPLTARYVTGSRTDDPMITLDGRHEDIRQLGGILLRVLLRQPPRGSDGATSVPPTAAQLAHLTPALASIVRTALASGPHGGYSCAEEFSADLRRAESQLADISPHRARRWRLALAAVLLVGLSLGGWFWRHQQVATGHPTHMSTTTFAAGTWQSAWVADRDAGIEQDEDGLRTTAPQAIHLVHKSRLAVPLTITYEAQIASDAPGGDLSLVWSERGEAGREPYNFLVDSPRVLKVQFGAFDNTLCQIVDAEPMRLLARHQARLIPGQRHRFRVDLRAEAITAWLDGVEIMRCELTIPLADGYLALHGFYPGKIFHAATIRPLEPAGIDQTALAAGDALLRARHYVDAATAYRSRIELGLEPGLAEIATYRQGLAEHLGGRMAQSRRAWAQLRDPGLLRRAEIIGLDNQVAMGADSQAFARFNELWTISDQAQRRLLVQQWNSWLEQRMKRPGQEMARIDALLSLRDACFPDDQVSGELTANALNTLQRFDRTIADFPMYPNPRAAALLALGRPQDLLSADWPLSYQRTLARFIVGDLTPILTDPMTTPGQRAMALCKLGRADDAMRETRDRYPGLLHASRAAELLRQQGLQPAAKGEALIALGRSAELLEPEDPALLETPARITTLQIAGRLDEADRISRRPSHGLHLILAMESGDAAAITKMAAELGAAHEPLDFRRITPENWFAYCLLRPLAQWQLDGDRVQLSASLRAVTVRFQAHLAKRPAVVAAIAVGDAAQATIGELPFVSERAAWAALAAGLRADIAGDAAAARAAYDDFASLPMHQRLINENLPNAEVERFVAWRRRSLPTVNGP